MIGVAGLTADYPAGPNLGLSFAPPLHRTLAPEDLKPAITKPSANGRKFTCRARAGISSGRRLQPAALMSNNYMILIHFF